MPPLLLPGVPLVDDVGHSGPLMFDAVGCWVQLVASLLPSLNSLLVNVVGCPVPYRPIAMAEMPPGPVLAVQVVGPVLMTVVPILGLFRWWPPVSLWPLWAAPVFGVVGGQRAPSAAGRFPSLQSRSRLPRLSPPSPVAFSPVMLVGGHVSTLCLPVPMIVESKILVKAACSSYALLDLASPSQGVCGESCQILSQLVSS